MASTAARLLLAQVDRPSGGCLMASPPWRHWLLRPVPSASWFLGTKREQEQPYISLIWWMLYLYMGLLKLVIVRHLRWGVENLEMKGDTPTVFDDNFEKCVANLRPYFRKFARLRYNVKIGVMWLLKLSNTIEVIEVPSFSEDAHAFLNQIIYKFDLKDALEMKNIEEKTYHDATRVVLENFQLESTFEDIDNLNFAFSLKGALDNVIFPNLNELRKAIFNMVDKTTSIPMVSRPYHPIKVSSILGEKMLIIAHRLNEQIEEFNKVLLSGKFVGVVAGYPEIKWAAITDEFVRSFGLHFYPYKTNVFLFFHFSNLFQVSSSFPLFFISNLEQHA
ncbi:hypothetical protein Taro_031048 [Colocasia esculenta]|uniref:Uncharacterized protein n=1 Tax=Colocasia esculenta TaxID=4460 RepID=A0A843VVL8_COLES|nr:hypothetical protein [Colocasia esculenta]